MAGVAFAVEGDGVGFATESYAASALYTTLASLSGALWRIRRVSAQRAFQVLLHALAVIQHSRDGCLQSRGFVGIVFRA
jgi:hypothetical protein